jgi:endonuclease G
MVVMKDSERNKLPAACWLSQGQLIRKLLNDRTRSEVVEGFMRGPYRTFQIAITDLEASTGFGTLKAPNPLMKTEAGRETAGVGLNCHCFDRDTADLVL